MPLQVQLVRLLVYCCDHPSWLLLKKMSEKAIYGSWKTTPINRVSRDSIYSAYQSGGSKVIWLPYRDTSTLKWNLFVARKENFQSCRQKHNKICTFNLETETVNVINNLSGKAIDVLWVCKMRLDIILENMLWLSIWENYIHYRPSDHYGLHIKTMNPFAKWEALAKKNKV